MAPGLAGRPHLLAAGLALLGHGELAAQQAAVLLLQLDDAGEGGGLIICSSNSLHPDVDPENCIAMFQATKKYGAYDKTE